MDHELIFSVFAGSEEELRHVFFLTESIREFGGRFADAPVWVYIPVEKEKSDFPVLNKIRSLNAEIKTSEAPEEALRFFFARKVYAAGKA